MRGSCLFSYLNLHIDDLAKKIPILNENRLTHFTHLELKKNPCPSLLDTHIRANLVCSRSPGLKPIPIWQTFAAGRFLLADWISRHLLNMFFCFCFFLIQIFHTCIQSHWLLRVRRSSWTARDPLYISFRWLKN